MPQGGEETTMKQGYYWATMKTGIASEIVWVTGRTSPSVYRIGYKYSLEASGFKDFEFINDGYQKKKAIKESEERQ